MPDFNSWANGLPDIPVGGYPNPAAQGLNAFSTALNSARDRRIQQEKVDQGWAQLDQADKHFQQTFGLNQQKFGLEQNEDTRKQETHDQQKADRASQLLSGWGFAAQNANTPNDLQYMIDSAKRFGVDLSSALGGEPRVTPQNLAAVKNRLTLTLHHNSLAIAQQKGLADVAKTQAEAMKDNPFVQNQAKIQGMKDLDEYERTRPPDRPQPAQQGQADSAGMVPPVSDVPAWTGASPMPGTHEQPPAQAQPGVPPASGNNVTPRPQQLTPSPTNVTPHSGATWQKTPEQARNERMAIMFPHMSPVLRQDPASLTQRAYGEAIAKNNATIDMKQREGKQAIQGYQRIMDAVAAEDPDVVQKAIGPLISNERFQQVRASIPGLAEKNKWDRAYQLNLRLHHLIENIGASQPGAARSDAALANVMKAVGLGVQAQTPEGLIAITRDAEDAMRRKHFLPEVDPRVSYIPQRWREAYPEKYGKMNELQIARPPAPQQKNAPAPAVLPPGDYEYRNGQLVPRRAK